MAAPYLAVGVFWCIFENAWLALFAYHAQIVLWARGMPRAGRARSSRWMWFMLPSVLAGPALYLLLPHMARVELIDWLARFHLSGSGLIVMAGYFGIVHPYLEQTHWTSLRERTPLAHVAFAGYHGLVLGSLLSPLWCVVCCVVLCVASWVWQQMTRASHSMLPAILSQSLADAGVVLVAVSFFMASEM
jgi:hypothetical protein